MKTFPIIIAFLIISFNAISQSKSNFVKGFEEGFKEGYCYNRPPGTICSYPIILYPPIPRLNESSDNYTQGYNRGFQYGLDLKRSKDALNEADMNLKRQEVKFNGYVSQNPVNAMAAVGMRLQAKYDARKDWIQQRIDGLAELKNSLYNEQTLPSSINAKATNEAYWQKVKDYINSIRGYDFADDYQFNSIQSNFNRIEKYLYDSYNEIIRKYQPVEVAQESKSEVVERPLTPPQDASTYLGKANEEVKNGNYKAAIENLNLSIEMDPNNPSAYNYRGEIYLTCIRNYEKAVEDFTKSIQMQPEKKEAYFYKGMALHSTDKNIEALKDFTKYINLDNENTDAYFMRGLIKSILNDRNGAITDYDEIIKREKTAKPTIYKMGTVYNNKGYCLIVLGKLDEALPYLNKALELEPYESYIWGSRGEFYYKKGDYKSCIMDMSKAIEVSNKTVAGDSDTAGWPYYLRGLAKIKLGQKQDGCKDLSKAGELGTSEAYKAISENCN